MHLVQTHNSMVFTLHMYHTWAEIETSVLNTALVFLQYRILYIKPCTCNNNFSENVRSSHQQIQTIYKDYLYTISRCGSRYPRANGSNVNTCAFIDHFVKLLSSVMSDWRPGDYYVVASPKPYNRLNRCEYIHLFKAIWDVVLRILLCWKNDNLQW